MATRLEGTVLNAIDQAQLIDDLAALIGIRSLGGDESPAQESISTASPPTLPSRWRSHARRELVSSELSAAMAMAPH